MSDLINIEKKINAELNTKINSSKIKHKQLYLNIDKQDILEVILFLKTNNLTKFRQLIDITAVDYPENENRFKLIYLLLSHEFNQRIVLDFFVHENVLIDSIVNIFPSAIWMEREIFDM